MDASTYHAVYLPLAYAHLATVLPAFVIGTALLIMRGEGGLLHRQLGRVYMLLMLATASITLFMPAAVGPKLLGHFGFIHLFSLPVFYTVPAAYLAARQHQVRVRRGNMIGLYIGGLLIAGAFALLPGRLLHGWLFQ